MRGYEEVLPLIAIVVGGILIPALQQQTQKEMMVLPRPGWNRVAMPEVLTPPLWGTAVVQ